MSSIIVEEWRDLWSFKIDFVLVSCVWVFASGNFLYLPYLISQHGGLVFVITYVVCMFLVCLPLIIMELAVGQLTGRAPVQALFNICPLFKGVGVAQIVLTLVFASYLAVMLSHIFLLGFYVLWEVMNETPVWATCNNTWNTEQCFVSNNCTGTQPYAILTQNSSVKEFLERYLIQPSDRIDEPGFFVWKITVSLAVVWFLVFLAVFAGVRWLGKVCYFTFTIPLLLLIVLLIRGITLDGTVELIQGVFTSSDGLKWERFLDFQVQKIQFFMKILCHSTRKDIPPKVLYIQILTSVLATSFFGVGRAIWLWSVAFSRCILSAGIGFGAFITLASYNKRSNNLVGDSFLILFVHFATTTLQVFTVIGICGYLASILNLVEPHEILKPGFDGLYTFLVALCQLPMCNIWVVVLLSMVAFTMLNSLAGSHAIVLMAHFIEKFTIWVILAFEIFAIGWFYCAHLLGRDIRQMIYGCCCWVTGWIFMYLVYLLPAVPIYIIVMNIWNYNFKKDIKDSAILDVSWSEPIGWCIAVIPILPIPIFMLYIIIKTCIRGPGLTCCQRFKYTVISPLRYEVIKPTPPPRYTATAPGYILLPQAPLAEPENYNDVYMERVVKVSNI